MPPVALRKLIMSQSTRLKEIQHMRERIERKPRDSLNVSIVKSRIDAINEIWSEIRKTHTEIMMREGAESDPYVTDGLFSEMQTTHEDAHDFLLTLRDELQTEQTRVRPRSASESSESRPRPAKLPKVDLPTFSGNEEDWESFSDLFTSLVHNVRDLDDSTKLQYLKSCMTGVAADWMRDVRTTNANYLSTWEGLQDRFCDPRRTVNNYLEALSNLPYLTRESATELRSFADKARHITRALTSLQLPVQHWDIWIVHGLSARLDPESRKLWEAELSKKNRLAITNARVNNQQVDLVSRFPTYHELADFITTRIDSLAAAANKSASTGKYSAASRRVLHAQTSGIAIPSKCVLCPAAHSLARCPVFLAKTPHDRQRDARKLRRCFNCLGPHMIKECSSRGRCSQCGQKHHSLIHMNKPTVPHAPLKQCNHEENTAQTAAVNVHAASLAGPRQLVILATALVKVISPHGSRTHARALLDQGSEASFISESLAQLLELPRRRAHISLSGVSGSKAGTARASTTVTFQSLHDPALEISTDALILPRLTSNLPSRAVLELELGAFAELPLADPHFHIPNSVDLILGADVYGRLLRSGVRSFSPSRLVAQETALGWIVSGPVGKGRAPSRRAVCRPRTALHILHSYVEDDRLSDSLQRFWELEELPRADSLKPEDEACENWYTASHSRDANGRYVVRLPITGQPPRLSAETRKMALGSLRYMHRRFTQDPALAQGYREFMAVYEKLGHMSRVTASELADPRAWYLPHHAIANSSKLRVVFDASRQTREKHCLNNFLASGPPLQRELPLILLNWRKYRFAFTADIVKMFRQISVAKDDRHLQRIVWAPTPDAEVIDYSLDTVTYGTACAPYLALRSLLQLARDERARFPVGAICLESETYVDDTFAGADDLPKAIHKRQEFIDLLRSGGFELDKWSANHAEILPPQFQNIISPLKELDRDNVVKTLGVQWDPARDEFSFTARSTETQSGPITKRSVLSNISRLFDPLGWLAPVTLVAKILMQDLWILKCDWDAPLPSEAAERWRSYCGSLDTLGTLSIERWLGMLGEPACQIHGFSDASTRAYAAAVYLRIQEKDGQYRVTLLASKTKVAPVKSVSIPNLELCGAALLVKLVCYLRKLDFLKGSTMFMWSDSEIVLRWLGKHPSHWKTFVANRVSQIQTELPSATWSHVPTKENPADIATRGATPADLRNCTLWWRGPAWLSQPPGNWPQASMKPQILHVRQDPAEPDILTRFSSLTVLIRVVAYCLRPLTVLRRRRAGSVPLPTYLTTAELAAARAAVIRCAQSHAFNAELALMKADKRLLKHSPLHKLNPIVSEGDSIIRVGGRLTNSSLGYEHKHPPILPRKSALSRLFVRQAHEAALHGGPTLTSAVLMRHVWVLGMRQLVKTAIRNCVKCQRARPRLTHQLLGDLPEARVNASYPFTHTGVDYAGPFQLRTTKGRGHRSYKGYIALFVCLATRAIHLEAVSDLTTAAFIAAYRRFKNRRGCCHLYSDNSTTFRGADRELRSMFKAASDFYTTAASTLANEGTLWTFIPPTTPHYGGLWEAGVKSTKHHLKRAFGEHTFTFEEFTTILTEIEACLNSRPLAPLSNDIDDLNALTPAHFLLSRAPSCVPDTEPPLVPENRLNRYQLMQRVHVQFWKRWSSEYLQHLQERNKWRDPTANFAVGQLVLLRDDRCPSAKWPLGRVIEVHPGPDGHIRVVTVKTACNTLRRHIARLSPLSIATE